MEIGVLIYVLMLFHLAIRRTDQKLSLPTSVLQTNSTKTIGRCLESILLQSHAQHVLLVCGSNATNCPSTVVSNKNRVTSWMLFNENAPTRTVGRRDFCVIAGDNVSHLYELFTSNHTCSKEKIVLMLPSDELSEIPALESLFSVAWDAGIVDVVIVLSDSHCRVFTYVPTRKQEHSGPNCPDLTPVLVTWSKDSQSAPISDNNVTYFPVNKISSLHLCVIQVLIIEETLKYWTIVLDFLKVAMNATFNVTLTNKHPKFDLELLPSEIQVTPLLVHEIIAVKYVVPAYLFFEKNIFAVPRVPTSSSQWARLIGELSDYVWCALIVTLVTMVGVSYFLIKGDRDRDFGFVILFVLQPLLGAPQRGDFLRWRGRIFFINWLMFCFILQSSYMCTLLSELTVPSTADALNSLDDLLNKTVLPIHTALDIDALDSLPFTPAQSKSIKEKLHERETLDLATLVQTNRHDIAYIVPRYLFDRKFFNMPYRILPGASIDDVLVPFRLNKPSPYERFFGIAFMRAMGAGAVDKVTRDFRIESLSIINNSSGPHVEAGPKPLSSETLGVLFLLWFSGCVLSFLSFIVEVCLHCTLQ